MQCASNQVATGTSKAYTPASLEEVNTFGFRGEGTCLLNCGTTSVVKLSAPLALASIAELCCLEISSRTQRSRECWSIISKVCANPVLVCISLKLYDRMESACIMAPQYDGDWRIQAQLSASATLSIM